MINLTQSAEDRKKEIKEIMNRISIKESIKTENIPVDYELRRDYNNGKNIEIQQGSGSVSKDQLPLVSDGFTKCQAVVMRNRTTGKTGIVHIEPDGYITNAIVKTLSEIDEHFEYMQQKKFSENIDVFIVYREDRTPMPLYEYFNNRKYNIKAISIIPGKDNRRGIIYNPQTNQIIAQTREKENDKLTYYKGFDIHEQENIIEKTQETLHNNMTDK